jgi:hypothetical protein
MAGELTAEAEKAIADIDHPVLNSGNLTDIVTQTSFNEPDDKIIIMP